MDGLHVLVLALVAAASRHAVRRWPRYRGSIAFSAAVVGIYQLWTGLYPVVSGDFHRDQAGLFAQWLLYTVLLVGGGLWAWLRRRAAPLVTIILLVPLLAVSLYGPNALRTAIYGGEMLAASRASDRNGYDYDRVVVFTRTPTRARVLAIGEHSQMFLWFVRQGEGWVLVQDTVVTSRLGTAGGFTMPPY